MWHKFAFNKYKRFDGYRYNDCDNYSSVFNCFINLIFDNITRNLTIIILVAFSTTAYIVYKCH